MNEKPDKDKKQYAGAILLGLLLLLIFNAVILPNMNAQQVKDTEYSYFIEQVDEGNVQKVEITDSSINFTTDETPATGWPPHPRDSPHHPRRPSAPSALPPSYSILRRQDTAPSTSDSHSRTTCSTTRF